MSWCFFFFFFFGHHDDRCALVTKFRALRILFFTAPLGVKGTDRNCMSDAGANSNFELLLNLLPSISAASAELVAVNICGEVKGRGEALH